MPLTRHGAFICHWYLCHHWWRLWPNFRFFYHDSHWTVKPKRALDCLMALSLDDRLLGEKVDNYCSSSDDDGPESEDEQSGTTQLAPSAPPMPTGEPQTGPKGVLSDYKQYKELKYLKNLENEKELLQQAKKNTLSCRTYNEDVGMELKEKALEDALDTLDEDDEFLVQYRQNRMRELQQALECLPTHNKVYNLKAENFVSEIDSAGPGVTVLVHVYELDNRACKKVDEVFQVLFREYPHVKFCRLRASDAHLSYHFSRSGVPAILVYKKGDLIGNLLGIDRDLGHDFYPVDLENYLIERGFLPDKTMGLLINAQMNAIQGVHSK